MTFIDVINYWDRTDVLVKHLGRTFVGTAKLHPDDQANQSELVGGSIAETRARIKALQYERKLLKEKYKECQNFVKACECYKNFDKDSQAAKVMYRQLNRKKRNIEKLTEEIDLLKKGIHEGISERVKILARLEEIKNQRVKDN